MFESLGNLVSRRWIYFLAGWIALLVSVKLLAPDWLEFASDGEFDHLPSEMVSIIGAKRFAKAFPKDLLASSVVIVVRREAAPLTEQDEEFIEDVVKVRLQEIKEKLLDEAVRERVEKTGDKDVSAAELAAIREDIERTPDPESEITRITEIRTFTHDVIGRLLVSDDKKASLIIVELSKKFLEYGNAETILQIERLLDVPGGELFTEQKFPPGLDVKLSGTATVGRDMLKARDDSARATEWLTVVLVIILLIVIYRAPLLALIPLMTVGVANEISLAIASMLSQANLLGFQTFIEMNVYMTVILYGAGVDYCLFLIARYKEELDRGGSVEESIAHAVSKVGSALTASATTTAFGIGMMVLAEFKKFQHAGVGIAISLIVVLFAALTFTPTLLRLIGSWAFWPYIRSERISATAGWISGTSLVSKLLDRSLLRTGWEWLADLVMRRPVRLWTVTVGMMVPFALIGVCFRNDLSYGLLSELPQDNQSVKGAKAVQDHFPAGAAGPLTVLLENDEIDFSALEGRTALTELTDHLRSLKDQLHIADIRSVSLPLGIESKPMGLLTRGVLITRARSYYVTKVEELNRHATRLDVIFDEDPFSRDSIGQLDAVEEKIDEFFQHADRPLADTRTYYIGTTANIRDLKRVTDHDRIVIGCAVLTIVFLILWLLLKKFGISLYLILTVFFSYFVTLGFTFTAFWLWDPNFAGLDWKVPIFLFTFLIAVGEDYNIYLMTRIAEEQQRHGPVEGIRVALLRTGSIISSCGIIMVGTFSSLVLGGSLRGMQQLGFALAFGVLLDSFVVRPILVPTYLTLLYQGAFGRLGRLMGGRVPATEKPKAPTLPEDASVTPSGRF